MKLITLRFASSIAISTLLMGTLVLGNEGSGKPLSRVQIFGLVEGGVSNRRLEVLIKERGIDFTPAPEYLQMLREAGADQELISALRSEIPAGGEEPSTPEAASRKPQGARLQTVSADPNPQLSRAHDLASEGNWTGAAAEYQAALRMDPNNTLALNGLGMALARAGNLDGAIEEYRRALASIAADHGRSDLTPEIATVHDNLGVALQKKGDLTGAVSEFNKAIQAEPGNAHAHGNLGLTLEAERNLDGALREYQTQLKLEGGCCQAQNNIGRVQEMKGDLDSAAATFRAALAANPNDPLAHYGLGTALERRGEQQNALEQYRLAARLAPSDTTIAAAYVRLRREQ